MARLKEETEQLTRQLISKVSGFQEGEENYQLCLQFANSNFRYHRFLDVDSHRVRKLVEGLSTKLEVHSQGSRAVSLKKLVDTFLTSPLTDRPQEGTATDTHYGLLLLLCQLADSPTNTDYQPPPPSVAEEPGEAFDWTGYLLDGEDMSAFRYSDTSSEEESLPRSSDDDDDDEGDSEPGVKEEDSRALTLAPGERAEVVSMDTSWDQDRGEAWLTHHVMPPYWRGRGQGHHVRGQHASSNLLQDWTSYQVRSGEVFAAVGQHVITEYQLVREVLWLLSGVDELFLFHMTDSGFRLKEDVRLSHLSGASMASVLGHVTVLANQLHSLQTFIDDVVTSSCQQDSVQQSPLGTQTFQAFADSLAHVLKDFRQHLSHMEREAAQQDTSGGVTISSLLHKLSPWLPTLEVLWEIFSAGVLQEEGQLPQPPGASPSDGESQRSSSARVSRLLTAIYDGLVTQDCLGQSAATHMVSVLLRLLLETSRPYLDMIGQWISIGHLSDPASEFVLQRNPDVQCLDETFWERAFTLNNNSPAKPSRPAHNTSSTSSLSSAGRCAEEEGAGEVFQEVVWAAPRFVRAVMREVVLTGKSMELLQALGQLPQMVQEDRHHGAFAEKSLYQLFVDSLKEVLGTRPCEAGEVQRESTVSSQLYMQHVQTENGVRGGQDWLLTINFQAVFSSIFTQKIVPPDPYDLKLLGPVEEAYVSPVSLLFQRCLYPHIRQRYTHVCSRLLDILKTHYHLMDFLHSMQHFYLMSAGDAMFDFYTQIFDKMRQQELWKEPSSLTLALQEALQSHHAQHANRLSITIETLLKTRERTAVGATDCLRLHFAVPWPVDVVINSKCQNLYNQVFRFLLQIKRAKYGLDQLRFSGLDKTKLQTVTEVKDTGSGSTEESMLRGERLHRLHILRFRLAYFVNSLHTYIMTRILHSTGLEFADDMRRAMDLQEVIEVHAQYVTTLHQRCLLHRKLGFLRHAVTKVLGLTLTFAMRWDQGVHNISGQTVKDMEVEFSRCIQFLAGFLNNIIKRGSFPHVEPLAYALVTSLPTNTKYC